MATHEDALLMTQVLQWGALMGLDEALGRIQADDFSPETVDDRDPSVRKALGFAEVIGTYVKQNVLDRDLVLDLFSLGLMWRRLGPAALRARERVGEPRMYENFEALVNIEVPAGAR